MPLHQRVGEIFLANEPAEDRECFSTTLERFLVPDRGMEQDELSVVLLVESPHTTEVHPNAIGDRYPLAGGTTTSAGQRVRDKFMQCEQELDFPVEPIGQLVHQKHDTVQQLGIMNVSQLPFQKKPYVEQDNGVHQNSYWGNYIECMKTIRGYPRASSRNCANCQCLDDAIVENLRRRLECLHGNNPNVLLVRCGGVAQEFYRKAINREPVIVMPNTCCLPHPSHHSWKTRNCQDACLRNILGRLRPAPA